MKNSGFFEELISGNGFKAVSVVMTMMPTLLRHLRREVQIKMIIRNVLREL